jgi:hypothetical protein
MQAVCIDWNNNLSNCDIHLNSTKNLIDILN